MVEPAGTSIVINRGTAPLLTNPPVFALHPTIPKLAFAANIKSSAAQSTLLGSVLVIGPAKVKGTPTTSNIPFELALKPTPAHPAGVPCHPPNAAMLNSLNTDNAITFPAAGTIDAVCLVKLDPTRIAL